MNTDSFDGRHKHVNRSEYTIYTDGSKIDKQVGAGAVIYHKNRIIATLQTHLPDTATIFQAEQIGIKTGCEFFFDNREHKPKYVKIISDSQAALLALNSSNFTSSTALNTAEAISNLAWMAKKVTLAWTKAHVGTEANEKADFAAKQAAQTGASKQDIPLPPTHRRRIINEFFNTKWSDRWYRTTTCKHTKLFLPQRQTEARINKTISLTKLDLTKYIKTITNHNMYSYFQFKCNPEINPLCRLCGEDNETAYHFLADCPTLISHRLQMFNTYTGLPDNCSPNLILKFMKHKILNYWLTNKDELIPQDIIDTINGDISDDDFT